MQTTPRPPAAMAQWLNALMCLITIHDWYLRFTDPACWLRRRMVTALLVAYQRRCRWMSIPRQVSRLKGQEGVDRTRAVKTLEALCGEFGSRQGFRRRVLESGGLEPLVAVLNHGSARAACASLYVLRSLVAEEGVTERIGGEAQRRVLELAASDNLRLRSRATWFVSHFATAPTTMGHFVGAVAEQSGAFQTLVALLERPLPEDFQFILEQQPENVSRCGTQGVARGVGRLCVLGRCSSRKVCDRSRDPCVRSGAANRSLPSACSICSAISLLVSSLTLFSFLVPTYECRERVNP